MLMLHSVITIQTLYASLAGDISILPIPKSIQAPTHTLVEKSFWPRTAEDIAVMFLLRIATSVELTFAYLRSFDSGK